MPKAIQLRGAQELADALAKLPKELQRTTESAALRAGMTPVKKKAIALVKVGSGEHAGLLKKSIGLRVKKTRAGQLTARVGPRSGFRVSLGTKIARKTKGKRTKGQPYEAFKDPRFYAHLVEYGTSRAPAQPFIRPAVDSSEGQIVTEMAKGYEKGLSRAVAKLRKK